MGIFKKLKGNLVGTTLDGVGNIITSIGGVLDDLTLSKEEKLEMQLKLQSEINRHIEARDALLEKEVEAYLADMQSARESNTKIQESANASWMAKNIAYILDIVFTAAFVFMLGIVVFKTVPETNKELFYTGFGALGAYVASIVNFHRGTSSGSNDKQKHIERLTNHKIHN